MTQGKAVPIFQLLLAIFLVSMAAPLSHADDSSVKAGKVSQSDELQFQQNGVAAQMQELQERMFRLAQTTRDSEPDDAAKLLLAVRRAREELIIEQMKEIGDLLAGADLSKATDEQRQVLVKLEELKKLLLATDLDLQMQLERLRKMSQAIAKLDEAIKQEQKQQKQSESLASEQKKAAASTQQLDQAQQEQQQTRKATEQIAQTTAELGAAGAKAGAALSSAGGAMSNAEASLGAQKPADAEPKQGEAIAQMQRAKSELEHERQKLMEEIEKQVRGQVIANLTHMLERQKALRETTEKLAPRVAQGDGQADAVARVKQLAKPQEAIANVAEQTIRLIEETNFSVALPPALNAIERDVLYVAADFDAGRAGESVIKREKEIEANLQDLLNTLKEAQSLGNGPASQCQGCKGNRNKLLAELKVLRMLQMQVNKQTHEADVDRTAANASMSPELKARIAGLKDGQEQVQTATDKVHKTVCPQCLAGEQH